MNRAFILACILATLIPPAAWGESWSYFINGNTINDIAVKDGIAWCAANGSVVRWNLANRTFTQYTRRDGLDGTTFSHIEIDAAGTPVVGYKGDAGVSIRRLVGERWAPVDLDGSGIKSINTLHAARDGSIWVGTAGQGVARRNGSSWKQFFPEQSFQGARTAIVDSTGVVWIGAMNGIWRFIDGAWRKLAVADGLTAASIRYMTVDRSGAVWCGTSLGACVYDGFSWRTFTKKDGLVNNMVNGIAFAPDGAVWFATESGVSRFLSGVWTTLNEDSGLISNKATDIAVDRENRVWIAFRSAKNGVCLYQNGKSEWETIWNSKIPTNEIRSVARDTTGDVWFASDIGAIRWNGTEWKVFTAADGLADNDVQNVFMDAGGRAWFVHGGAAVGSATCFDGKSWTAYTAPGGIVTNEVVAVAATPDVSWFVTGYYTVRYDGKTWDRFPDDKTLIPEGVLDIDEDNVGKLWFATDYGLACFDGVSWHKWSKADGVPNERLVRVRTAGDGTVWMQANDATVCSFDGTTFTPAILEKADEITGKRTTYSTIQTFEADADGIMWVLFKGMQTYEAGGYKVAFSTFESGCWAVRERLFPVLPGTEMEFDPANGILMTSKFGLLYQDGVTGKLFTTGFPERRIGHLIVDHTNSIWIDYPTLKWTGGNWETFEMKEGYGSSCYGLDGKGQVCLFGLNYGLYSFQDGMRVDIISKEAIPFKSAGKCFIFDSQRTWWFGTNAEGIWRYDGTAWTNYSTSDGIPSNSTRYCALKSENDVWFSTANGICHWDGAAWTTHFTGNSCGKITIDGKGIVWAEVPGGIARFDGTSWVMYSSADGYMGSGSGGLAIDKNDIVWSITAKGLFRFDGNAWKTVTVADGLLGNAVSDVIIDLDNRKWFFSDEGISILDDRSGAGTGNAPRAIVLRGNRPNPFNAGTTIEFDLYSFGAVMLDVYDILGRRVRRIEVANLPAGRNALAWDGTDGGGARVSSGVYLYRLRAGGHAASGRMTMVK